MERLRRIRWLDLYGIEDQGRTDDEILVSVCCCPCIAMTFMFLIMPGTAICGIVYVVFVVAQQVCLSFGALRRVCIKREPMEDQTHTAPSSPAASVPVAIATSGDGLDKDSVPVADAELC